MTSIIGAEKYIFDFNNGIVKGYYIKKEKIYSKEYIYIHLQKRPMYKEINSVDKYLIIPNKFINWKNLTIDDIKRYTKSKIFYKQYFRIRFKNLKEKLKG